MQTAAAVKLNPLAKLKKTSDDWRRNHQFVSYKPSPDAGRTFIKKLIRAVAAGQSLLIQSANDVHEEYTAAENEEFEEWFLANQDSINARETGHPLKFVSSDADNGGCHMFSAGRGYPSLAADAVGQVWEGQTFSWNRCL